jgi:hypothetical protein
MTYECYEMPYGGHEMTYECYKMPYEVSPRI